MGQLCTFDDRHPDGAPREEQMEEGVVKLIEVERVEALLGADEDVLVARLGMDPRRRAVDAERAPVEDLGEARAHVHLGSFRAN